MPKPEGVGVGDGDFDVIPTQQMNSFARAHMLKNENISIHATYV